MTTDLRITQPTPETDARVLNHPDGTPLIIQGVDQELVAANYARSLERERDQLKKKLDEMQ